MSIIGLTINITMESLLARFLLFSELNSYNERHISYVLYCIQSLTLFLELDTQYFI